MTDTFPSLPGLALKLARTSFFFSGSGPRAVKPRRGVLPGKKVDQPEFTGVLHQ